MYEYCIYLKGTWLDIRHGLVSLLSYQIKNNTKGVDKLGAGGGYWGHVLNE